MFTETGDNVGASSLAPCPVYELIFQLNPEEGSLGFYQETSA